MANYSMVEDFEGAAVVASGEKVNEDYDKVYHASNEDLSKLFSNFSVEGKDVLTVCGSGDQAFYSYRNGANEVNIFDINKIAYYYLMLRKWSIEYLGEFYPPRDITKNVDWVKNLLNLVQCNNYEEQSVLMFWHLFIKRASEDNNSNLFYRIADYNRNNVEDVELLKEKIAGKGFKFLREDITGDVDKSKKYDVIISSNILEYCQGNILKLLRTRDNFRTLLNPGGIVVCSSLIRSQDAESLAFEKTIFNSSFEREKFSVDEDGKTSGYVYIKK